jgi:heat shock protein HtpX
MLLADQIRSNRRRTWMLFALFLPAYAPLGAAVSVAATEGLELERNLVAFGLFALAATLVVAVNLPFADELAARAAGGRLLRDRREAPELWDAVETMAVAAGVPRPRVYLVRDPAPNAFSAGRGRDRALVGVSTGLLERLDKEELEGVVAHEISHIRNLDVRVMTYAAVVAGSLVLLFEVVVRGGRDPAAPPGRGARAVVTVLEAVLGPGAALLIHSAVSRRREFLADATAADLTRYPQGLASALRQISESGVSPRQRPKTVAHLYIVAPAGRPNAFFNTHPPLADRLARLDELAGGQRHTRRPRARSRALAALLDAPDGSDASSAAPEPERRLPLPSLSELLARVERKRSERRRP